jgi:hypothetical protein
MKNTARLTLIAFAVLATTAGVLHADEEKRSGTLCTMKFDFKGWSAFYSTGKGQGTITCDNGQSAKVKLKLVGGGITGGKTAVRDATGRFTEVSDISELYGGWAQAGATAAAGPAASASVVTKGDISLTLVGTGSGVQLGFGGGKLTIKPADAKDSDDEDGGAADE